MNILQIKDELYTVLMATVSDQFGLQPEWLVDQVFFIPESADHGFFSTNAALQLNSLLPADQKQPPRTLAENIVTRLRTHLDQHDNLKPYIADIQIAGPGFINFFATDQLYVDNARDIVPALDNWGKTDRFSQHEILIEFTDPNPFKEFHIGHLMSNCIGESLARLYEWAGARVHRLCYQGDVGMHVAKTVWAEQQDIAAGVVDLEQLKAEPLPVRVKQLGQWYAIGSQAYADGSEQTKEEIKAINKHIFSRENEAINQLYDLGRDWSLAAFEVIYQKLGTKFEKYYFESETGKLGYQLVKQHVGQTFIESQGAIIYPGDQHGLHNRVFINSQDLPTYEAKELGLAAKKDEDFSYDSSIIVTGNEVNEYFKVLLSAMGQMFPQIAAKTKHVGHGMLRLPEGKMSSRTGNVVTGDGLLKQVAERIAQVNADQPENNLDTLAVSAVKFSLLKQNIGKDVVFDIDESISFHGATGIYLQYTHARTVSLLKKSGVKVDDLVVEEDGFSADVLAIYRELFYFPYVTEQAALQRSPNLVANYLIKLAQIYNSYYAETKIIGSQHEKTGLLVSLLVKHTLHNGLQALGISAVDQM